MGRYHSPAEPEPKRSAGLRPAACSPASWVWGDPRPVLGGEPLRLTEPRSVTAALKYRDELRREVRAKPARRTGEASCGRPPTFGGRNLDGARVPGGARVCDPQQLRQTERVGKELKRLEVRACCGSQSRGPGARVCDSQQLCQAGSVWKIQHDEAFRRAAAHRAAAAPKTDLLPTP